MENIDMYVENCLHQWGAWLDRIANGEEGWPPESLLVKMLELGTFTETVKKSMPLLLNDLAQGIQNEVNIIADVLKKPECAAALTAAYTRSHGVERSKLPKIFGVSKSTFYQRVDTAKTIVERHLLVREKSNTI